MSEIEFERRVRELFEEAFDLDVGARRALLESLAGSDPDVAVRLQELFAHLPEADSRFDLVAPLTAVPAGIPRVPGWRGRYEVIELIGEGATGVVFSARQLHPERDVAIKVLKGGLHSSGLLDRFDLEARILARLDHPGIASVLEAGTEALESGGGPLRYLVMEYVAGSRSLTEYARSGDLAIRERIDLLARVADAVHHGHQKGVIHRDLKPANVLVTPQGRPKVIDFGVARLLDSDITGLGNATLEGRVLGSLPYMSPEQASGRSDVDTRTDVWALGAMLYELVTDRPLRDVSRLGWPEALRVSMLPIEDGVEMKRIPDRDLRAIALRALSADVERRYPSADAFAAELRTWLAGEPVSARTPSAIDRLCRTVARNRIPFAIATFVVVASVSAAVFTLSLYDDSKRSERLSARRAEALRRADYFSRTHRAQTAAASGHAVEAQDLLEGCPEDLRDWEWDWLSLYSGWTAPRISFPGHRIFAYAPLPDGRILCGCVDGAVRVHDPATNRETATWTSRYRVIVNDIAVTQDGRYAGVVYREHGVAVFDVRSGNIVAETEGDYGLALFVPDGDRLLLTEASGITSWAWADSEPSPGWLETSLPDWALRDNRLYVVSDEIMVVDVATGALLRRSGPVIGKLPRVAVSDRGILVGDSDGWLRSFDPDSLEVVWRLREAGAIADVAVSPDARRIAVARRRHLDLLDAESLDLVARFKGQSIEFGRIWFSADESCVLATSQQARDLQIWSTNGRRGDTVRRVHDGCVESIRTSSDGRRAVSLAEGADVVVWDLAGRSVLARHEMKEPAGCRSVLLDRSGARAAACGYRELLVFDALDGRVLRRLEFPVGVTCVDSTPDFSLALIGGTDGTARVLDVASGRELVRVKGADLPLIAVRFSPDGRSFVEAARRTPDARVWRVRDGKLLRRLSGCERGVSAFEFDPRRGSIFGSVIPHEIHVWSASAGVARVLQGHETFIQGLSLSADGRRLFSVGGDGIRIWDVESGSTAVTIRDECRPTRMVFEPVNGVLISGHENGAIRFRP